MDYSAISHIQGGSSYYECIHSSRKSSCFVPKGAQEFPAETWKVFCWGQISSADKVRTVFEKWNCNMAQQRLSSVSEWEGVLRCLTVDGNSINAAALTVVSQCNNLTGEDFDYNYCNTAQPPWTSQVHVKWCMIVVLHDEGLCPWVGLSLHACVPWIGVGTKHF